MATMHFSSWEKGLTNIRLVPKLILLMVFSTVLLLGKQLWDAQTFYSAVSQIQKDRAKEQAVSYANLLKNMDQADADITKTFLNQASAQDAYVYIIDRKSGKVVGHPSVTKLAQLNATTSANQPLSALLPQLTISSPLTLEQGRYEYAELLPQRDLVVVGSQSTQVAKNYYYQYLWQIAWQTGVMILAFMVLLLGGSRIMLRQINYLKLSIKNLAQRNLIEPIEMNCRDEFGDLARELETARFQLQEVLQAQRTVASELSSLSDIMSISMVETKASAQEEFAEIDQLASAMSEMTSTVQTVAEHARQASDATVGTSEQAAQGQEFVGKTMSTINQLSGDIRQSADAVNQVEARVEKISTVIVTIQSISEQTNLLALNAAIEAARAGDAGRGFAVVADEVRNLAQRTQTATVEIQEMISQLQQSAQQAVGLMEQSVEEAAEGVDLVTSAGDELEKIVAQVKIINDMNFHIATAAEQQTTVADEMNQNLTNVRELVEASVTVVTELAETSDTMHQHANDLETKIKAFQV
ncbi:methyl-accepting chemotaxis protein [Photobacterium angustum]|uniref:Methyl-accepting chemotaxis protein n=1 Tax=Photobacterium angustum TaxID=661 RepID=A0A2S7VW26_PHOAN|nr:methyl-accepting chemotaxis protein [Photobacterium angustum]PQJ65983.1 methyl-accepting chemotaxis protein [Photobacterium angustum]